MKLLGIFGTSGFAREVADIVNDLGFKPIFIARDKLELDGWLPDNEFILESDVIKYKDMSFVMGIGDNFARERVWNQYKTDMNFINLIHPSASFGRGQRESIDSKRGVIVCAGVRFTNNIDVGNFTIFNLNSTIGHDVIVGDFSNISPGANISGNVQIGRNCWIGTGVQVNQGNSKSKLLIGNGTTIGSGSVVVKNCEENSIYIGVPAKKIT